MSSSSSPTPDTGSYPVSFYFKLSFKGEDAAFQEVTGISKEYGIEEIASGGENRFKYKLPTVATSKNLVLKRALVPVGSQLANWCSNCIDQSLANKITTHDVSVSLLGPDSSLIKMWTFSKAYPVKYSISDLRSQENGLVIESIELAYAYFTISPKTHFYNLFE
jgi:phage tail-like protein